MPTFLRIFIRAAILFVVTIALIFAITPQVWRLVADPKRHPARRETCTSNLKDVGTAFMMYVQDYDERAPRAINNASLEWRVKVIGLKPLKGDNILNLTLPYLRDKGEWRCFEDKTTTGEALNTNGSLCPANASSFQMNLYLTGSVSHDGAETTSGEGVPLASIAHAETTVLLRDGDSNDGTNIGNVSEIGGATIGANLYTVHSDHNMAMRHKGMGSYAMADGHVKMFSPERVSPMKASDDPEKPCPDCLDVVNPKAKVFFNIVK